MLAFKKVFEKAFVWYFVLIAKGMANIIPKEIWVEIWSRVDFRTQQKSCTLVCKYWFEGIRGSTSLSGQMALDNSGKSLEDINLVLSHWEKLRIVRMSSAMSNVELLQLDTHPSLEKIIFPKEFEIGIWGKVTNVCFDLKNKSSEITSVENIVELHILNFFESNWFGEIVMEVRDEVRVPVLKRFRTENISLEPMARMMLNLETLHIMDDSGYDYIEPDKIRYFAPFFRGLQDCKSLSELNLHTLFGDYADYTPNIKKLKVKGNWEFDLEDLDWIAKFEKLEILKLEQFRTEHKETDIEDFTRKMFGKLTHLKSLELDDCSLMYEPDFLMNIQEIIPSLKTLDMKQNSDVSFPMDVDYLVEVLDSIGNIKNLYVKGYCKGYCVPFYILNNKDFDRTLTNNLDEDAIKSVFQTAMDIINKKFSIELTRFEIVDNEYGWTIKKDKGKPPTMTQLAYKCTFKDELGKTCTEFFAEKAKLEEHIRKGYHGHSFPICSL